MLLKSVLDVDALDEDSIPPLRHSLDEPASVAWTANGHATSHAENGAVDHEQPEEEEEELLLPLQDQDDRIALTLAGDTPGDHLVAEGTADMEPEPPSAPAAAEDATPSSEESAVNWTSKEVEPSGWFKRRSEPTVAPTDFRDPTLSEAPHEPLAQSHDEVAVPDEAPAPCLLYTSPSPRDQRGSRMPSSA